MLLRVDQNRKRALKKSMQDNRNRIISACHYKIPPARVVYNAACASHKVEMGIPFILLMIMGAVEIVLLLQVPLIAADWRGFIIFLSVVVLVAAVWTAVILMQVMHHQL